MALTSHHGIVCCRPPAKGVGAFECVRMGLREDGIGFLDIEFHLFVPMLPLFLTVRMTVKYPQICKAITKCMFVSRHSAPCGRCVCKVLPTSTLVILQAIRRLNHCIITVWLQFGTYPCTCRRQWDSSFAHSNNPNNIYTLRMSYHCDTLYAYSLIYSFLFSE